MTLKFFFKRLFVREKTKNNSVRTEFILKNIFSYMLKDIYKFNTICAENQKEKDTLEKFKELLIKFKDEYGSLVKKDCFEIGPINEDTIESILLNVSAELFSNGINWYLIIGFFYFVGELAFVVVSLNLPISLINIIFDNFFKLVTERLEVWIQDHNGWEGIFMTKEKLIISSKFENFFTYTIYCFFTLLSMLNEIENFFNVNNVSKIL